MATVKIIGAGSIGNHLAHGFRSRGWDVTMVDVSQAARDRTKETIYPNRYGAWDDSITLTTPEDVAGRLFDVVIIGTPPATHLALATS